MMLFIELYTLNRAWNGLTDEELLWDPMPGAWTVHPRDECQTATPFVVGAWAADFDADLAAAANQGKAIEPLTSIAWLFWHVSSQPGRTAELDFLGRRTHCREWMDVALHRSSPDFHNRWRCGRRDANRLARSRSRSAVRCGRTA
jgi:hypothetical protein